VEGFLKYLNRYLFKINNYHNTVTDRGGIIMVKVEDYEVPENLYYHKEYLWARVEDGKVKIGMTDFAQKQLHDIVYVELPSVGDSLTQGEPFGTLESVKAVSDLVAPISGTIESVNEELESKPELLNEDPYGEGWILTVEPSNLDADLEALLNFDAAVEWHKELAKEG
jgi:glycine cleavage system H protein